VNTNYLFNQCLMGSATCTLAPPPAPPPPPPPPQPPAVVSQVTLDVGQTATLGAVLPLIAIDPARLTTPPRLGVIALPMLSLPPPQLTDPDVVPPNISYLDY
jgi:hypothetical protein